MYCIKFEKHKYLLNYLDKERNNIHVGLKNKDDLIHYLKTNKIITFTLFDLENDKIIKNFDVWIKLDEAFIYLMSENRLEIIYQGTKDKIKLYNVYFNCEIVAYNLKGRFNTIELKKSALTHVKWFLEEKIKMYEEQNNLITESLKGDFKDD